MNSKTTLYNREIVVAHVINENVRPADVATYCGISRPVPEARTLTRCSPICLDANREFGTGNSLHWLEAPIVVLETQNERPDREVGTGDWKRTGGHCVARRCVEHHHSRQCHDKRFCHPRKRSLMPFVFSVNHLQKWKNCVGVMSTV